MPIAGDTVTCSPTDVLTAVQGALEAHDSDVIRCDCQYVCDGVYSLVLRTTVDSPQ
jgi:DNA polymerase I